MRHDMYRVITTPPRTGSYRRNRKSRLRFPGNFVNRLAVEELEDFDSGPRRLPMSMYNKYGSRYGHKGFSDLLGPLRRFLRSRVGRSWNSVHSEMSRELDHRSIVRGGHFWLHVSFEVETDCYVGEDDKIYSKGYRPSKPIGLYVHPTSGVLCYNEYSRRIHRSIKENKFVRKLDKLGLMTKGRELRNFRIVDDLMVLEKTPNGWFGHYFAHHKPYDIVDHVYSGVTKTYRPVFFVERKGCNPIYRKYSRQLGRKDLRKYRDLIAGNPF